MQIKISFILGSNENFHFCFWDLLTFNTKEFFCKNRGKRQSYWKLANSEDKSAQVHEKKKPVESKSSLNTHNIEVHEEERQDATKIEDNFPGNQTYSFGKGQIKSEWIYEIVN